MKKWIVAVGIVAISIAVIFWAMAPMLTTYAQIVPEIDFEVGNRSSIEAALIQVKHTTINHFREIYGDSIIAVSLLAMVNALIAVWFLFKDKERTSE